MKNMLEELSCWVPDSFKLQPTNLGSLDGKTFALKDCFSVKGHVSSFGHPAWRATHIAAQDTAPVVKTLLANGAEMAGLAKMDQLAYSLVGNVGEGKSPLNSLYPDRFTGGSSSGPAAAVAGGLTDIGIGTDTAGSIRVPAAACGLYGIRPTHGRIDLTGVLPWVPSYDTVGLLSKSATLLLQIFLLLAARPKTKNSSVKRILVASDCLSLAEPIMASLVHETSEKLAHLHGIDVQTITLGSLKNVTGSVTPGYIFSQTQPRKIWERHGEWMTQHLDTLAPDVVERALQAKQLAEYAEPEKRQTEELRTAYADAYNSLVQPGTIVVLPVIPGLPPQRTASPEELAMFRAAAVQLNAPAGVSGAPQVVIPIRHNSSGLTYGVGLLGAKYDDKLLLETAKQI